VLLIFFALQGVLALAVSLGTSSMDRRAFLFGYSLPRLIVSGGILLIIMVLAYGGARGFLDSAWQKKVLGDLDRSALASETRLLNWLVGLFSLSIIGIYVISLQVGGQAADLPYQLLVAFDRFFYPALWLIFLVVEIAIVLLLLYQHNLRTMFSRTNNRARFFLLILLLGLTCMHWITLATRSRWIVQIPGWYWQFNPPKPVQPSYAYLLLIAVLGFVAVQWILRNPHRILRNLILSVGLAYLLQIGFGLADGRGFESIRLRYTNTRLSDEVRTACESSKSFIDTVRDYEEIYGETFWLGTKPPGLVIFYQAVRDSVGLVDSGYIIGSNNCFRNLTLLLAITFPLISALVVVPIYATEKVLLTAGLGRFASGFVYMSAPSVLLMSLVPDQSLFPLLAMTSVFVLTVAITHGSRVAGVITGALVYLSVFVSFSLLPLLGIAVAWIATDYLTRARLRTVSSPISLLLAIGLGFVVLWLVGQFFLNYDPVQRFQIAFQNHRNIKQFRSGVEDILQYGLLNSFEFAWWSSWPMIILLISGWAGSVSRFLRHKADKKDAFAFALLITFVALNVVGQTKGEVGRLWIFFVPLASMVASRDATKLSKDPVNGITIVFMLQLVTALFAFLYMDFRMF